MGYLEAPLSLNPSDREPKTTIVTRVMLGTVLTNRCRAGAAVTTVWFVGGSDIGFLLRLEPAHESWLLPVATKPHLQQASPDIFSTSWPAHLSAANDPPLHHSITSSAMAASRAE
jgi:hypothetical protein